MTGKSSGQTVDIEDKALGTKTEGQAQLHESSQDETIGLRVNIHDLKSLCGECSGEGSGTCDRGFVVGPSSSSGDCVLSGDGREEKQGNGLDDLTTDRELCHLYRRDAIPDGTHTAVTGIAARGSGAWAGEARNMEPKGTGQQNDMGQATSVKIQKKKSRSQLQKEYRERQKMKEEKTRNEIMIRSRELSASKSENERLRREQSALEARVVGAVDEYMVLDQPGKKLEVQQRREILPAPVTPMTARVIHAAKQLIDSAVEYATQPTERALEWIMRHMTRTFGFEFLQYVVPLLQMRLQSVLVEYEKHPEKRDVCVQKLSSIAETRRRIFEHQYKTDPDFGLKILLYGWVGQSYSEGACMPGVPRIPETQVLALSQHLRLTELQLRKFKKAWCTFVSEWNGTRDEFYDAVVALDSQAGVNDGSKMDAFASSLSLHTSAKTALALKAQVRNLEDINALQRDAAFKLFFTIVRDIIDPVQAAYVINFCPRFLPNVMYLAKVLAFSDTLSSNIGIDMSSSFHMCSS